MPFPSNAIRGQKSLSRKREKLAREAEREFSSLPDWMFWEKDKLEEYLANEIRTEADTFKIIRELCEFVRLMLRSTQHYEERDEE